MNFPDKVTFRVIDRKTKKPIRNIALLLILYAHRKNNYSIEAKISNENGEVTFTKNDCLEDIENSRNFYLMDYASTLEECLPHISLEVLSRETIDFVLKIRKERKNTYQNYWDCSDKFLHSLGKADNADYLSKLYDFSESDLWRNEILEVFVEKTPEAKEVGDKS